MKIKFVRERITQLRMKLGVSEYQMSLELGKSKSYIQGITSGGSLPSLTMLFSICDYFKITPLEFLDSSNNSPDINQEALFLIKQLKDDDVELIFFIIKRLLDNSHENIKM